MNPSRILVADPHEGTWIIVREALAGRFAVACVADGPAALKLAREGSPDTILLDLGLPGMDAIALVRELRTRADTALIPIIFLADRATVEPQIRIFRLAADDFLAKPFGAQELVESISVALKVRDKTQTTVRLMRSSVAPDDFSSASVLTAFGGTLDQIGLPTLLTLLDMERKTGMLVLILQPEKEKARLFFSDGRVIRAQYDRRDRPRDAELVYELLGRTQGKFEFRSVGVDPKDEIRAPTVRLLLEGARILDETRRRTPNSG